MWLVDIRESYWGFSEWRVVMAADLESGDFEKAAPEIGTTEMGEDRNAREGVGVRLWVVARG